MTPGRAGGWRSFAVQARSFAEQAPKYTLIAGTLAIASVSKRFRASDQRPGMPPEPLLLFRPIPLSSREDPGSGGPIGSGANRRLAP